MKKLLLTLAALAASGALSASAQTLKMNDLEYFEARGTNVLVYNNLYNGSFYDEKFAGLEIIQRGERICTGGGVRLMNTPEQWDIFGDITAREVDRAKSSVEVEMTYADYGFAPRLRVTPKDKGVLIQILLSEPVPQNLVGKAGFNLEFFPASYFGKNYLVDGKARILPKYPMHDTEVHPVSEKITQYFGESTFDDRGRGDFLVPLAMSTGHRIVLAPEDDALRVSVSSESEVSIFDGRHLAQNGMFVLRSLLPAGKTGVVLEWYLEPSVSDDWIRKPNIGFSQVGYSPAQKKVAVVELDKNDTPAATAKLLKVNPDGSRTVAKTITTNGRDNPYGVAITGATWAGNANVISTAYNCYRIWKLFPDMIDPEFVLAGMNYILGCHPYTNFSFVTAVGVNTKNAAYGNNRADYSVIPGGIVPGLLVKEDFYENKDDYPFHWGENECCINTAPQYVLLCLAADEIVRYLND